MAPYTPPTRRSAKVAPTPTSPLEAELSELRSRLEAVEAPIAAEVAELRARLDFVERASPHHSPDAADRVHSRLDFVERSSPHSPDGANRVHRTDASPYSSASRTRALGQELERMRTTAQTDGESLRATEAAAEEARASGVNDINSPTDAEGRTPLYVACTKGHIDAARLLLDKGAAVDRARNNGSTPLYAACFNGHVEVTRLLLNKGAEVDRANDGGGTPLFVACQEGRADAARLLLDNGAKVDMAEKDGRTPLDIAKSQGHSSIVALLEEGWN